MTEFLINFENTPFLKTSETAAHLNRLNWRCEMLLTRNRGLIEGKRVLDLASHDGRFSYGSLKLGAAHVNGIEGRSELVDSAKKNLIDMGCDEGSFEFASGDLFEFMRGLNQDNFDVILCFGFFYHTIKQAELMEEIKRLAPQNMIMDTGVYLESGMRRTCRKLENVKRGIGDKLKRRQRHRGLVDRKTEPYLVFRNERHDVEANTIEPYDVTAYPTKSLLELYFSINGFQFEEILWTSEQRDWRHLEDYRVGRRVSYITSM